jgi:hypothetical protein
VHLCLSAIVRVVLVSVSFKIITELCYSRYTIQLMYYSHFNPLNPELNPICYLLALLAHHNLHISRIRDKSLTLRLLMSYIYMECIFLMFLDHTRRRTTVGRTPLDERSARHRDLYLTTHDTHNRQISMLPVGVEPTISVSERPAAAHLLRSYRGFDSHQGHGYLSVVSVVCCQVEVSATS